MSAPVRSARPTRADVLADALAVERAGGTWSIEHVAAFTGLGVSVLHRSDCPRDHERSLTGVRPRLVFVPAKVRAWKASLMLPSSSEGAA